MVCMWFVCGNFDVFPIGMHDYQEKGVTVVRKCDSPQ